MNIQLISHAKADLPPYFPTDALPEYHPIVNGFSTIAGSMGARVLERDKQYWHVMAYTARALDTLVDEDRVTKVELHDAFHDLKQGEPIPHVSPEMAVLFNAVYTQLSPQRLRIVQRGMEIYDVTDELKRAHTAKALLAAKRHESDLFADILSMQQIGGRDTTARDDFNRALKSMSLIGYILDTVVDLESDRLDGTLPALRSTQGVRAQLLLALPQEVIRTHKTWNRESMSAIIQMLKHFSKKQDVSHPDNVR